MFDVSILIQALPYIRSFRDKLFVVKLGGELLQERSHLEAIAGDLTLLHMVGIRLIVVHGGGPQADQVSQSLGIETTRIGGRRVTNAETLEVAKMVFAGKINTEVLSALAKHGARPVGLSGIDAGLIRAHKRPMAMVDDEGESREVDFGFVGDVDEVDPMILVNLVESGFLPVVSSLATDGDGNILNVNADTIASEIAAGMQAQKLIVMTGVSGIYRDFASRDELISVVSMIEAQRLFDNKTVFKGMRPKLEACMAAVARGVSSAHIINGLTRHSLLMETFTNKGIGTMLVRDRV